MTQYHLHLKGYVGGADFNTESVLATLAANPDAEVSVLVDSTGGQLAIIAQGEQLGGKEYYDKIYLAYWNGSLPQHEVPMSCVDKIMIDAHWQYKQYPFSLRFDSSDAINYPQYDVDLKKKYTRLVS